MAIDTPAKRLSLLRLGYVVPDSTLDAFDRAAIIHHYYIAPTATPAVQGTPFVSSYIAGSHVARSYTAGGQVAAGYTAGATRAGSYVAGAEETEGY